MTSTNKYEWHLNDFKTCLLSQISIFKTLLLYTFQYLSYFIVNKENMLLFFLDDVTSPLYRSTTTIPISSNSTGFVIHLGSCMF